MNEILLRKQNIGQPDKTFTVGIVGARGFVGEELKPRIQRHPHLAGVDMGPREKPFANGVPDIVIFSLPNGQSDVYIEQLETRGIVPQLIVDISSDHRDPNANPGWVYGLPELTRRSLPSIQGARRISNPGCYATALQLAAQPVLELVTPDHIAAPGVSGYSGAGKKALEPDFQALLAANFVIPYKSLDHDHQREVTDQLSIRDGTLAFMPSVANYWSGITMVTRMMADHNGLTADQLKTHYQNYYQDEPVVQVSDIQPDLSDVVDTDTARVGGFRVEDEKIVIVSVIDNLGKGAAGQAIQNINAALGFPETTGLILEKKDRKGGSSNA